jgi:hypothetical protein
MRAESVRRLRSLRPCTGGKTRRLTVSFGDQQSAVCRVDAWLLDFRRLRGASAASGLPARSRVSGAPAAFRRERGRAFARLVDIAAGGRIALTRTPVSTSPRAPDHLGRRPLKTLFSNRRCTQIDSDLNSPYKRRRAIARGRDASQKWCLKTVTKPFQLRRIYSIRPRGY